MKNFFLLAITTATTLSVFSQEKNDTLKIKWKDSRIWIFDVDATPKDTGKKEEKKKDFTHWGGVDIGLSMLTTATNQFRVPEDENGYNTNYFLDLKYGRSLYLSLNLLEKNIRLYKNYVTFVTGIGIEWDVYNFKNNLILNPDSNSTNSTTIQLDTTASIKYIKNQLKVAYIKAPLLLEFNTNNTNPNKSFHLAGGLELAYKIDSWTKQKFEENNYTFKAKRHDDYNLTALKYGIAVRAGYGGFTLFANYTLSTLFDKENGPEKPVYPLSAGLAITF